MLRAGDFLDALQAAGMTGRPGDDALRKAGEIVAWVGHRAITANYLPSLSDTRLISQELGDFEIVGARISMALNRRLDGPVSDEDLLGALSNLLTRRCDPFLQALGDAMSLSSALAVYAA